MQFDLWQAYVVTGFLTAFTTLCVGIFVYSKNAKSVAHRAFMLLALAIFQWSFCTALQGMQTQLAPALFWGRICHIGVLFIPVFFYYFALKMTTAKSEAFLRTGFWFAGLLCIAVLFTPYFIPTERANVGVNFIVQAGPLYAVIIAFFVFYVLLSLAQFYTAIRHSTGARKKHLEYFFWASVIGYGIGVINFFPAYGITVPPYPYSAACGAIYFWIIGYAILKHQLFDIEIFFKKGMVFAMLFGVVYGIVSGVIYFAGLLTLGAAKPWMPPFSIALAMLIYEPLKKLLENWTHRFLFQKKRQAVSRIQTLSAGLSLEAGRGSILPDRIVNFLTKEMELKWCAFYPPEHPLASLLVAVNRPLLLPPLSFEARTPIEEKLRSEGIEAVVPIKSENEFWGILVFGSKKSDEPYNQEDEALLHFLQNELGMLFLSAKLLAETIRSGLELSQRAKMASLRHLARGVHHEVRNPLHTMALFASATLDEMNKGHAKRQSADVWLGEIEDRTRSMQEEIGRIRDSLSRFAQFARPGEENPRSLLLTEQIDKFLALMREGHKLDEIQVQKTIPEAIKVTATEGMLQEALFSLFMNSFESMAGKGQVALKAQVQDDNQICLAIKDSGPGIPKQILPKVFEPHFTTKADTGAAGISLSTIKHRIERLGGRIEVKSEPGQGAEFLLYFKQAF